MLFGTFVQTVVLIIMTYKTNWDEQVLALLSLFSLVQSFEWAYFPILH